MKQIRSILTAALLALLLCTNALAAASAQLVRTFVYDGTLYTYVEISGAEQPITKAEAKIGTQSFAASSRLETVQQAGSPVSYLLLVDNSTSMPAFQDQVTAFAQELAQAGGENTKFTLATFGDSFQVAAEDVPAQELAGQIGQIPFDERVTRLHTAIDQALDYFESLPRQGNELRSMVVLSDAVQYDPEGGVPYETLLERLERSDVMLHSIGFGEDQEALDSLGGLVGASGGSHQVVGADLTAEEAAGTLSDYSGRLFVTGFDLAGCQTSGQDQSVSITFASGGQLVCRAETEADLPDAGDSPAQQSPAANLPADPGPVPSATAPSSPAPQPSQQSSQFPAAVLAAGAAVLVAAAVAALLLSRKKKTAPGPEVPGIYMRLEVVQGELAGTGNELNLVNELVVGRDSACDISFQSPSMSRRNTRIFTVDGAVYIEDLGSQNGTLVNGARIDMANPLRSGDEITIGDTIFCLKF